jgi:cytochrome c oxidase subunit 4
MSDNHEHFVIPLKYYVGTLIALLILTVVTVAVAQIDLGALNIYLAMFVAMIKAGFVIFFFMGVRWDEGFNKIALFGSLLFVAIFFVIVLADVFSRDIIYSTENDVFNIKSPVKMIGDDS